MAVQNKKVKYYGDSLKNPILGEFTEKKIYKGIALKEGLGFNRDYLREYCLKFSLLIIWYFLYQLNWLVLLILSMLFQIIRIGEIICTTMRHNLICEYISYNIFFGSHIPLSIYNKTTPHFLENKIIINTLMFIEGHIELVFSALFVFSLPLLFYSIFSITFILPLDMNKLKIHPQSVYFM